MSLITDDVPKVNNQLVALSTTGDGNCLFNAVSILLFGNKKYSHLFFWWLENCSFYSDHDAFKQTRISNPDLYPDVLFAVALTKRGDHKFSETGSRDATMKEEALVAREVGEWSSLVHVMGISSVLSRPIVSLLVIPDGQILIPLSG